jgi:putative oxidoreductase
MLIILCNQHCDLLIQSQERRKTMSSQAISTPQTRSSVAGVAGAGSLSALLVPVARLFFTLIFLFAAPNHFAKTTIAYAASQGVPLASVLVPISGVLALAGGLSVLLGYHARVGAWLLVLFLVPVTVMLHNFWAVTDPMMHQIQQVMFFKNVAMLGGALLIAHFGAGPYSVDARRNG